MQIKVRYFASFRESFGKNEELLQVPSEMTVVELWLFLTAKDPLSEGCLFAVNKRYEKGDKVLSDGDEVAFFPPVTGG